MVRKTIEETYEKLSQVEHILKRPGMYIGTVNIVEENMWVVKNEKIVKKDIKYSPAFLKIFDEILTNATDHSFRDPTVSMIKVEYCQKTGMLSVFNNGKGIPIVKHKEHNLYVPELLFGNLLSSSNYNDKETRTGAGTNGIGATITNIYSKKFTVETVDSSNKLKYVQTFEENMSKISKPEISKYSSKSYTKITWYPDYQRFFMKNLDNDTVSLIEKRVYDCIACTDKKVSIYLNDKKLEGKGLLEYSEYFFGKDIKKYYENMSQKVNNIDFIWECVVIPYQNYEQVSFVNGNNTHKGGKHIEYITNQIVSKLKYTLETKRKVSDIKSSYIKEKLFVFLRATVSNPSFDSQTKEYLTTQVKDFGCKVEVSDNFISKLYKTDIIDDIINMMNKKDLQKFNKEVQSNSNKKNLKIPKLDDAYYAGTSKSKDCILVLAEGDSAKSGILSGLSPKDKDHIGIFALKGKLLNIQEATKKQLETNEEIKNLMIILGLQRGFKYKTTNDLRYGAVYISTDQDHDGSHIKGLILNFFKAWFPELVKLNYINCVKTPLVRVDYNKKTEFFYNLQDFETWKEQVGKTINFKTEYKKGLGSLTKQETKIFFSDLYTNNFKFLKDNKAFDSIDLAFTKKDILKRKQWVSDYNKEEVLNYAKKEVDITDFINKELKHFSVYDNSRSIPNITDGLKPSQRKILYSCFKRNLITPIRVAQLAGYVSENAEYHHGEASLNGAIVNMAQDFVGSNNINVLHPKDMFGTRCYPAGTDSASPRYIHTCLEKITKLIYREQDFPLLEYMKGDEGDSIEPYFYTPIIPMILINGTKGIGTGFSTTIPSYNPNDIIDYLRNKLRTCKKEVKLIPWYNKFKGSIEKETKQKYICKGVYERISDTIIKITELPIHKWTENYKEFLDSLIDKDIIKSYKNNSTDTDILFEIKFKDKEMIDKLLRCNQLETFLDLVTPISLTNLILFDEKLRIRKFENIEEIIDYFFHIRLDFYGKRKEYILKKISKELEKLGEKYRFMKLVIEDKIKIFKQKKESIIENLKNNNFKQQDNSYDYLLKIYIDNFTYEELKKIKEKIDSIKKEKETIEIKPIEILWDEELVELKNFINKDFYK